MIKTFNVTRRRGFIAVKLTRFVKFTVSRYSPRFRWN